MSCGPLTEHDDGPAYAEFPVQRGDTTFIGAILQTQDIFTAERKAVEIGNGRLARWVIVLPEDSQLVATTTADGGLDFDPPSGTLLWPMTAEFTGSLPDTPCQTILRVESDEGITTWINGYIVPRG